MACILISPFFYYLSVMEAFGPVRPSCMARKAFWRFETVLAWSAVSLESLSEAVLN